MLGKTLGHYAVSALIGRGGMGEVYKAKDQKLGRDVAIKILPEEFGRDMDRVARFQREAKLLASLNHPNIAATDSAGGMGEGVRYRRHPDKIFGIRSPTCLPSCRILSKGHICDCPLYHSLRSL